MSVVANAQGHYHNGTINVHPLSDQETDPPKIVEPPYQYRTSKPSFLPNSVRLAHHVEWMIHH